MALKTDDEDGQFAQVDRAWQAVVEALIELEPETRRPAIGVLKEWAAGLDQWVESVEQDEAEELEDEANSRGVRFPGDGIKGEDE